MKYTYAALLVAPSINDSWTGEKIVMEELFLDALELLPMIFNEQTATPILSKGWVGHASAIV